MKIITIVGNKETGKTTLFRQLTKYYYSPKKKGEIETNPLINYAENLIKIGDNVYKIVDTPSFVLSPKTEIEKGIKEQTEDLLKVSDLICWVVDKVGEEEFLLKRYLKKLKPPQILIFNKIDLINSEEEFYSYQTLRPQHFLAISTLKETNFDKLAKQITSLLPHSSEENDEQKEEKLKLLIFGPPNSGKSTLMNCLLKKNRSLATSIAGTTQEPVISDWNLKGTFPNFFQQTNGIFSEAKKIDFQLVDTAGITKEQKLKESLWKKCDLAWAVVDATLPLTKQMLQIVNLGEKHNKPLIIVINKCDLLEEKGELKEEIKRRLKSLSYVPIIYTSALKGAGIKSLLKILEKMLEQSQKKLSKKELANLVEKMLTNNPPKYFKGNKLKVYFAKQEPGLTQTFIFFVNNPQWAHFSYQRYMVNYLRKNLNLEYLPIKIILKKSE